MNKSGKRGLVIKKTFIILLSSFVILISSLLLLLHFFLKSPYFTKLVEQVIEARTGRSVELGSVYLAEGVVIFIEDLIVKETNGDKPIIVLPGVEIGVSLSTLLKKEIERIKLRGPKLFINLKGDIRPQPDSTGFSTPFSLNKVSIDNGEVILQVEEEISYRVSSINLSLEKKENNQSEVKGSLFLDELDSTVPFQMTLDPELLNIQEGHMEITLKELENLPYKNRVFLNDKEISGTVNLGIDIYRKEGPEIRLLGRLQNVSVKGDNSAKLLDNASGELEILFAADKGYEEVEIEGTGIVSNYINGELSDHKFSLNGAYDLKGHELKIKDVSISSPLLGSLDIEGGLRNLSSENPEINLTVEGEVIPLNMIKGLFTGPEAELLGTVAIEGHGRISFSINGRLKSPLINGTIHLNGKGIKRSSFELGSFKARVPFMYGAGVFSIREALMQSEDALIIKNKEHYGRLNNLEFSISDLTYKDSVIHTGTLQLRADKAVIYKNGDKLFTEEGITISASLTAVPDGAVTHVTGTSALQVKKGNFSSPDGYIACEEIDMEFRSGFGFNIPFTGAEFRMNAEATGFELLIGRFYGSFKDKNLSVSLEGDYSGTEDSLKISWAELGLTDIGTVLLSGNIEELTGSPYFNANINLTKLNNKKAFDFFLRETFQESLPLLSQMDVGGTTSMNLSAKGTTARFNVNGELSAADVNILEKDSGFSIEGLNISLPLEISYPKATYSENTERFGSLKTREIKWGNVQIEALKAFPAIRHNAVIFKEDIVILVFGGDIRLKDIRLDNILSQERSLLMSVHINSIDLDKVSRTLNTPSLSGSLSGSIPKAGITANSLVTEGEITLELFGGKIRAGDLSINNIFSSVPSLQTSISIEWIDLGELTSTFEFGHISGKLQGHVRNLVISNGQAESFESYIETVQRKGIDQWISVQALEKITVLGGSSTSVLNRGVYRLFKKYRYEKIGFKGSLRNDNFLLLGLTPEGNRHYIVKGGLLPPKVDVINYTQNVSFQEMVERLKRINQME